MAEIINKTGQNEKKMKKKTKQNEKLWRTLTSITSVSQG